MTWLKGEFPGVVIAKMNVSLQFTEQILSFAQLSNIVRLNSRKTSFSQ